MRLALISVLGMLVACGGDDAIDISTNQDNFCTQIADVVCHNAYDCCTEGEIENLLNVSEPRTEAQCREDIDRLCERGAPQIRDSLKAGRVTFDSQKLNDCLTSIAATDGVCSQIVTDYPWAETCKDAPWVGTVATMGACFYDFDCQGAPDSYCGADQKCKMKPTAGFPCGTGCASAYYCASNGTCAPKLAAGAPCVYTQNQCDKDLFCDTKGTTDPADDVCAAKMGAGASCTSNLGCTSGECIPGTCMGTTISCYVDTQCQSRCAGTGTICTTAANCGIGSCSNGVGTCSLDTDCTSGTCIFPRACLPGDCVGDPPVCTAATRTADYCTNINAIPFPEPN